MKDTSVNTGDTQTIAMTSMSVSETERVRLSKPKEPYYRNTQSPPSEQTTHIPALPIFEKFEVLENFNDFFIFDCGIEHSNNLLIFGQQMLLELLNISTPMACWWHLETFSGVLCHVFIVHTTINGYKPPLV